MGALIGTASARDRLRFELADAQTRPRLILSPMAWPSCHHHQKQKQHISTRAGESHSNWIIIIRPQRVCVCVCVRACLVHVRARRPANGRIMSASAGFRLVSNSLLGGGGGQECACMRVLVPAQRERARAKKSTRCFIYFHSRRSFGRRRRACEMKRNGAQTRM